ncbi:MAG: hypothetical protein GF344_00170 [Chitinivibrionales bacterium]|nr:hypothetical protein [Chitinivibrionales bacterium]MBD3355546.1 hypothetical protein [Chitinivibrionales bacterium]
MVRKISGIVFSCFMVAHADAVLFDWGFNINGDVYTAMDMGDDHTALPDYFDFSGFDFDQGLGTISVAFDPDASGTYHAMAFLDHEIDEAQNTFFNEYGSAYGVPADGLTWEIDEPGYAYGDIYDHLYGDAFDNSNAVESTPDDVSMGLGWSFSLGEQEYATIEFTAGADAPEEGFYLAHYDDESSDAIFFSSRLSIEGGTTPVPEPCAASLLFLSCGLLLGAGIINRGIGRRRGIAPKNV